MPEGLLEQIDLEDLENIGSDDDKAMQQLEETFDVAEDLYDLYLKDALETHLGFGPEAEGIISDSTDEEGDADDGLNSVDTEEQKKECK